tara:strand:- start:1401 stop:2429 length:1029 start_codon:yes stop_codon:yes gene_type:complete
MFENIILYTGVLYLINFIFLKKKFLIHKSFGLKHKQKNLKGIVLSGGTYLFISFALTSFFNEFLFFDIFLYGFIFLLLGIFSDLNFKISPQQRLLTMFLMSFLIIYNSNITIDKIDFYFLDNLLKYKYFSILFSSICLVILINGSNFIDGTNGNAIGYYLLCILSLSYQYDLSKNFDSENILLNLISFSLLIFLILNFFNKCFLGDNGAYYISAVVGILAIHIFLITNVSSFYIANLFIYPTVEVFISFIRKIFTNKSPYSADKMHLHHLIQKNLKNFKISKKYSNNLTSIVILFLLSIFFYLINLNVENKLVQLRFALGFCITYIIIYLLLKVSDKTNKSE